MMMRLMAVQSANFSESQARRLHWWGLKTCQPPAEECPVNASAAVLVLGPNTRAHHHGIHAEHTRCGSFALQMD
jgi:hypothetical protein